MDRSLLFACPPNLHSGSFISTDSLFHLHASCCKRPSLTHILISFNESLAHSHSSLVSSPAHPQCHLKHHENQRLKEASLIQPLHVSVIWLQGQLGVPRASSQQADIISCATGCAAGRPDDPPPKNDNPFIDSLPPYDAGINTRDCERHPRSTTTTYCPTKHNILSWK